MKRIASFVVFVLAVVAPLHAEDGKAPPSAAEAYLKNPQSGDPQLKGAGNITFGSLGLLLVAERGAIVAIDPGERTAVPALKKPVADIVGKVAGAMGAKAESVQITDLAVHPMTKRIYLSVRRTDGVTAILTVDGEGAVAAMPLDKLKWARVKLPEKLAAVNITDLALAQGRLIAAGVGNEEFASKIFSVALPLEHGQVAQTYSAETYHVAHRKWETRAPIQSFVLHNEGGNQYVVGSFACTPVAKFPLANLADGAKVKGTSVLELGSGNRPLDMFTYESGGKQWLVTHTQRFHPLFAYTPSKYWAARIDMKHLAANDAANTNEKAALRDRAVAKDPQGIEVIESLHGAVQVDKYDDQRAAVLREAAGGKLNLELADLP